MRKELSRRRPRRRPTIGGSTSLPSDDRARGPTARDARLEPRRRVRLVTVEFVDNVQAKSDDLGQPGIERIHEVGQALFTVTDKELLVDLQPRNASSCGIGGGQDCTNIALKL